MHCWTGSQIEFFETVCSNILSIFTNIITAHSSSAPFYNFSPQKDATHFFMEHELNLNFFLDLLLCRFRSLLSFYRPFLQRNQFKTTSDIYFSMNEWKINLSVWIFAALKGSSVKNGFFRNYLWSIQLLIGGRFSVSCRNYLSCFMLIAGLFIQRTPLEDARVAKRLNLVTTRVCYNKTF